jgi:hypothetical protein
VYLVDHLWITYYVGGRPIAESSGSTDRDKAANLLKQRIGEVASGREVSPERATVDDLCALVIADYRVRRLRDASIVKWRYEANIKPAIGNLPAQDLARPRCGLTWQRDARPAPATQRSTAS